MTKTIAAIAVLAALAPGFASADEGVSARRPNHFYGGGGLYLASSSTDPATEDSGGAGFFAKGAGVFNVSPVVGIGVNGNFFVGQQTTDESDIDVVEAQFAVDGGAVLFDLLYLSLGVQSTAFTIEDDLTGDDVTFSYVVLPLGIGVFKATDSGYVLGQVRFGSGTASNDQDDSEEDLGFVGLRAVGQIGKESGIQFLGGIELETYDFKDLDFEESYFRIFAGAAFGT